MRHTLIVFVQNEPLVLSRVVGLLARRGFAIEGFAVGPCETADVSRLTIVVATNTIEQVVKQLCRLVPVLAVTEATPAESLEREFALVKIDASSTQQASVAALCTLFQARVLELADGCLMVEVTGAPDQLERFIELIRPFGIRELARSGRIAMSRPPATKAQTPTTSAAREVPGGWRPPAALPTHSLNA